MNFEDEVYVRLYVRDSATWVRLGFEGQAVLMFLLRKLDRAGVLDGIEDPCEDVALLTGVPRGIVDAGMPRLLQRGVFQHQGTKLVMPNFLEAQNCRQSDRVRQQESRAKRRLDAIGTVTNRDKESQNVTSCHQLSPTVTVGHSVHCIAQQCIEEGSSGSPPANRDPSQPTLHLEPSRERPEHESEADMRDPARDSKSADVERVFAHWRARLDHPKAKLVDKRRRLILARLRDFSADELCKAIEGCSQSDWHMGKDPKTGGMRYDSIELILRDAAHVERFLDIASGRATGSSSQWPSGSRPRRYGSAQRDEGIDGFSFFKKSAGGSP